MSTKRRTRVQKTFEGPGRTHQSFKEECDINTILGRYRTTGFIEHVQLRSPHFGDFANAQDYQEAMNSITSVGELFASLPARIRDRVANDPAKLMEFIADPDNQDELIELGLILPIEHDSVPIETPPAVAETKPTPETPKSPPKTPEP